jgi:CheY-like chemotaxis protein
METILALLGHDLRVAFDGPSALPACEEFMTDVVFLDIGLPGMNGYEVAKRIRAFDAGKGVHIVAVSGYALEVDRARALESGCTTHLAKPFDVDSLSKIVDAI